MKDSLNDLIQRITLDPNDRTIQTSLVSQLKRLNLSYSEILSILSPVKQKLEEISSELVILQQQERALYKKQLGLHTDYLRSIVESMDFTGFHLRLENVELKYLVSVEAYHINLPFFDKTVFLTPSQFTCYRKDYTPLKLDIRRLPISMVVQIIEVPIKFLNFIDLRPLHVSLKVGACDYTMNIYKFKELLDFAKFKR